MCHQPIDLSVPWPDPMSFEVDHIVPTSHGGGDHIEQLAPSHRQCNNARSNLPPGTVGRNSGALG